MSSSFFKSNEVLRNTDHDFSLIPDMAAILRNINFSTSEGRDMAIEMLKGHIPQYSALIDNNLKLMQPEHAAMGDYLKELQDELVALAELKKYVQQQLSETSVMGLLPH